MGWKLLFAVIPPPKMCGGWAAFAGALVFIGLITAVVQEFATLFGCVLGVKPSVTAITFVALGTSLPDTFASVTAARGSKVADAAVGNITGSNSVNVFLGLGLPWTIAAIYWLPRYKLLADGTKEQQYYQRPAGELAFSVTLFLSTSFVCFILLILRRVFIGGELGGPKFTKFASAFILIMCWVCYIFFSTLQAYKWIEGF